MDELEKLKAENAALKKLVDGNGDVSFAGQVERISKSMDHYRQENRRDLFAAHAMQAYIVRGNEIEMAVKYAFKCADVMLAASEK